MEKVVFSIPHTGTRFLMERLGVGLHTHSTMKWSNVANYLSGKQVIVPLRRPEEVWVSWCNRYGARDFPYGWFFLAWAGLARADEMFALDVICIDKKEDPRITDWERVGHESPRTKDCELTTDLKMLWRYPIVSRNYDLPDN